MGLLSTSLVFSAPIKNIEILGLNVISRGTVLSYLPVEVGDDYGVQTSSKIIRSLYKTHFFKDIEVTEDEQTLKITVIENPHIKYLDLLNHSEKVINNDTIKDVLSSMDLTPGKIFNKRQLDELIKQLKATYISQGYYSIKITPKVEIDSQNRVGVELDISEGEVARIKSMHISGSKVQKEEDLLALFEIGEPNFFIINYFTEKDHYSKVSLDAGIEAMKSYYINLGYLDFKVIDVKTELSEDKQSIDIAIQINEGDEYKVGKIEFTGDTLNQSSEKLSKLLTFNTGDIFERKRIIKSIKAITGVFTNQGYAFTEVDTITFEDKAAHAIGLKFKITPNRKVYINRISITGNTRTQDEVIRREIGIHEGGLYSDKELEESISKIKRLGFFSDVKMQTSKLQDFEDKINLRFNVEEAKTGTFSIGLSHSNNTGALFNVGMEERNFLGTGNTLNAKVSQSDAVKEIDFYFSDPYFTQDKHSISYGLFSKKTDGSKLDVASYKINETGVNLGYSIPITKDTRIGTGLRISSIDMTCGAHMAGRDNTIKATQKDLDKNKDSDIDNDVYLQDGKGNYLNIKGTTTTKKAEYVKVTATDQIVSGTDYTGKGFETKQCADDKKTEVKVSANWSNNTLNNYNFPTKGNTNSLGLDVAFVDFQYYKLKVSHKSYYALNKHLTLNLKGSIGIAQGYGGKEVPFFKRYYGGGSSSVRGFSFNSLGAKYPGTDIAKGGELSMLMGVSMISPLTFLNDSKNMRAGVFIDAGGISEKASNFETNDFRASAGVAFSWLTPIGPLGIYFAKPFLKKAGDKTKTFEFTIGTSF
ncbi:Outer membrane protein assembly factor YaeT precursor [uncultured Candidatus Thioglobus sp.]|nr:Outer membrane protein assembly factor YaeT precursor [uncultured Candidatus Thioglobus sp.]